MIMIMNQKLLLSVSLTCLFMIVFFINFKQAFSDPQTQLINNGCSQYNVTDMTDFNTNINATFADLRAQLGAGKLFATAQQPRGSSPVYAMIQCRSYLSPADCVACYAAAESLIRNCSASNGARVVYLGCSLRYESSLFYDQSTQEGRFGFCGNRTASQATAFSAAVKELVQNLQVTTPKISGFFVASKEELVGGGGGNNTAVYGVAQCVETISESGCRDCLATAYDSIQRCFGNAFGWAVDVGCFLRYSDTPFFADNQTTNLAPFLKIASSSKKKAIIGGVVGGGTSLVLIAIFFLIWFKFYRKTKTTTHKGNLLEATEFQGPVNYRYKDLISATASFSEENKLGEGGFGDIYKGTLENGKIVAVKRLVIGASRRIVSDFENEVKLISNVHHRNLIRLLGCCSSPDLLLVYEYMAHSSLDKFLFGEKRGSLNWKQRFDIIVGTARGLAYLHEDFHVCIIHRDIKPSNILLDDDFQPKIADFGLARLLPENQSHLSTKFAGTLGYTAPEYAIHGQLSVKVDAYSYGVVVLEIISGRKSTDQSKDTDEYLLKQAWKLYENDMHKDLVDETIDPSEYKEEEIKKVIEIALMCTQSTAASRPSMSQVVVLLKSEGIIDHTPVTAPTFVDTNNRIREDTSTSTGSTASNATASVSQLSAR
ncbi:hypothetical protein Ddye_026607 [Dipteronia dyeriana]|uniref:Cysteine-rich receptor-like protein kinase 2 n=1 Tax=Dipteronia dyeriana TaxID=168575 RepID=A0AAD9TMG8_9ROSI|nr:hypothetical protein Ddye_026607 [Dipteronia dyeriana]